MHPDRPAVNLRTRNAPLFVFVTVAEKIPDSTRLTVLRLIDKGMTASGIARFLAPLVSEKTILRWIKARREGTDVTR